MRPTRLLVAAAACLLLFSACGEEQPAPTTNPASTPTTSPSTTAPGSTTTAPGSTSSSSSTTQASTTSTTASIEDLTLAFEEVASGFEQPVFVTSPPGDGRLFVVDQPGRIWVIDDADPRVFLDIRGDVAFGGERGLLGLAFPPDFSTTGHFYVDFTAAGGGATHIAQYSVSAEDADLADPSSGLTVLTVDQPAGNHNGGMIAFGPDGYLWIGMGDGGGANDTYGNGQRPDTLLGAMLRIDVAAGDGSYSIPATNPFADGVGGAPEVYATGLRNPWRFSFDGDLVYIGDVGQGSIEEIDVSPVSAAGLNYGWPIMEGSSCFRTAGCDQSGLVLPVAEYTHGDGCSITGGFVYRGSSVPELDGVYFYSDYCSGFLRSFAYDGSGAADPRDWTGQTGSISSPTSFGRDASGEVYVVSAGGSIYRIVRG